MVRWQSARQVTVTAAADSHRIALSAVSLHVMHVSFDTFHIERIRTLKDRLINLLVQRVYMCCLCATGLLSDWILLKLHHR